MTRRQIEDLEYKVTGACIEVHKELGPGLLEKVYHQCLKFSLQKRGISFVSEKIIEVAFLGEKITGYEPFR